MAKIMGKGKKPGMMGKHEMPGGHMMKDSEMGKTPMMPAPKTKKKRKK